MQRCYRVLFAIVISIMLGICLLSPLKAATLTLNDDGIPPEVRQQILAPADNLEKMLESQASEISLFYVGSALWQATRAACGNGDYVYAYQNLGLQVIDFSNPSEPQIVSEVHHPGNVGDMVYDNGFVYVAAGYKEGILIFDVSDPNSPVLASSITEADNLELDGSGVDIIGTTAYLSCGDRFLIADISNPHSPQILDVIDPSYGIRDAVIVDPYAYLAGGPELDMWDISGDPAPVFVGRQYCNGDAFSIAGSGDTLYVANRQNGLYIFRSTSYGWPSPLGQWSDTTSNYIQVEKAGHYAYLVTYDSIKIIDVQTPSTPVLAADWVAGGFTYSMSISGDKAYLADWYDGASRFDISSPASPALDGRMATPGMGSDLEVMGNYAFEANGFMGLQVLDMSDPESPVVAASYDTPGRAWAVAAEGNAVYLSDDSAGVMVFDVSDPMTPAHIGTIEVPYTVPDMAIAGGYAYFACGDSLLIFDISAPLNPVRAAGIYTGATSFFAIDGNHAYMSIDRMGLQIVDITDPTSPQLAGACSVSGYDFSVGIVGTYAYLSSSLLRDISIIDISDPENPVLAGQYQVPGPATEVAWVRNMQLLGDYLYLAFYTGGFRVLNVSDPLSPYLAGSYNTLPLWAWDVDIVGDYVYLTCDNGFLVLRQADCNGPDGASGYNIADAVYLIHYIFMGGPGPDPLETGDLNCDGAVNLGDAVYLIDFIFRNGQPPCGGCY